MSTVTVAIAQDMFEDEVIDFIKKKLRKVFRRRLIAEAGKRAAGVLGGLLVPEPVVSKIIAIGFGIWTAWTIVSILYEFFAMQELFEETLQRLYDSILLPMITGPNPPSNDRLRRILQCMARQFDLIMLEVGLINQALSGKTLADILQDANRRMEACLEIP